MLHNSGPFGPNEVPVNMGAPVNMTPMSGSVNIANNISTLTKLGQQPSEMPNPHYPVPSYPTYGHPHMNMNAGVNPYPSYPPMGFQSSYMSQNSSSAHETNWQNGVIPMNLNIHNDNPTLNYSSTINKRSEPIGEYKEHFGKPPINVPQVQTKAFHKHLGMENNHFSNYMHYNPSQTSFKRYEDCNLDLSTKSQKEIDPRRKSLETTVKLIENILSNSTRKSDNQKQVESPAASSVIPKPSPVQSSPVQSTSNEEDPLKHGSEKVVNEKRNDDIEMNNHDENSKGSDTDNDRESGKFDDEDDSTTDSLVKLHDIKPEINKDDDSNQDMSDSENEYKPEDLTANTGKGEVKMDTDIEIKVEPTSWVDVESFNPFQRDVNGMPMEDAVNVNIVNGENSVNEAKEDITNGSRGDKHFECPHCNLLFNHPKRFLIHYKWHSFGLTNEKKVESLREKEIKKYMKREARVVERMNMHEVTDMSATGKKYPCKDCDKVFIARGSLKNHRQRYHPSRVKDCKICGKTMLGWIALRAHLATHTSDSGYQCSDCPKRFKYSHSLAKHRDTHLEKTHGCEQCPKMFGSVKLLKMHMKTHERLLRGTTFHCTYCGKGFFESYSLQVHERTHRNERPFLCEICNTSFGTNSSLKRHLKVSHSTAKPFECQTCHRSFVSETIRDRHEQRVHGDPDSFKFPCNQCPCRYLKAKDLRKHMYKAHPKGKRKKKVHSDSE